MPVGNVGLEWLEPSEDRYPPEDACSLAPKERGASLENCENTAEEDHFEVELSAVL